MRWFRNLLRNPLEDYELVQTPEANPVLVHKFRMTELRTGAVVPFESSELPYIKHHALRALCGLLMDRHTACQVCPFCGNDDDPMELIVKAESQVAEQSGNPLIALYFNKVAPLQGDGMDVVNDWAPNVTYGEKTAFRKVVVNLLDNGNYYAQYGPIVNAVDGDHSSGLLDRSQWQLNFYCAPEPAFAMWRYWDSVLTAKQSTVPEFLCLRIRGEWWVIDRDIRQGAVQQVAALAVANNPSHPIQT